MERPNSTHIPILEPIRGIAAIAVCLFHFTRDGRTLNPEDTLAKASGFGWLGVLAFFAVSGFIIPYSMNLRSYTLRDGLHFFIRRLKRLEPPYLVSILLVLLLPSISMLVPGYRGVALCEFTWPQLLAHLGYLNAILGYEWINPVFWTLAIEFQYYIFSAIVFPLLVCRRRFVRLLSAPMIACLGFAGAGNKALLFHWLPLFAIGMSSFQYYSLKNGRRSSLLSFLLCICFSITIVGLKETVVGATTALAIIIAGSRRLHSVFRPISFVGTISYSLYLLHEPVGNRLFNIARRVPELASRPYVILGFGIAGSIFVAYGYARLVEMPSVRWAKQSCSQGREAAD